MKIQFKIVILIIFLAGCVPSPAIPVDAQNTAMAVVQTYIALTQTALSTPTVLPTVTPQATLIPTLPPPPILTPDAVQVERWREYQTELAKSVLSGYLGLDPDIYRYALCEWDILQGSSQELYVWAYCSVSDGRGADFPAVVYLEVDGSVQNVEVPSRGSTWESDINKMFPKEVQEKFDTYTGYSLFDGRLREMSNHIKYREQYPETPPMVVLSSTFTSIYPTPSPLPTQPPISIFTPDAIQIERWREYQTELAKTIFPNDPPEWFFCEWVILGRSDLKVYVWAVCGIGVRVASVPLVISLNADGSIQNVEKPQNWTVENIEKMFPEDVRNKFNSMESGEAQKMLEHLDWRLTHPGEPPLIILSAMPTLTPAP